MYQVVGFTLSGGSSCLDLEKGVEGGAVELLGKASDCENDDVSHMPHLHHQVDFILTIDNNLETVLIIAIQLNLQLFNSFLPSYPHLMVEKTCTCNRFIISSNSEFYLLNLQDELTWKGGAYVPRISVVGNDVFDPGFTTFILFRFTSKTLRSKCPITCACCVCEK